MRKGTEREIKGQITICLELFLPCLHGSFIIHTLSFSLLFWWKIVYSFTLSRNESMMDGNKRLQTFFIPGFENYQHSRSPFWVKVRATLLSRVILGSLSKLLWFYRPFSTQAFFSSSTYLASIDHKMVTE